MAKSIFVEYLDRYFPQLKRIVEKVNDKRQAQVSLFKSMLRQELSVDLRWESNTINSTIVAADVVALDSALPLKKRDKISTANGELPKLGMKMRMTEKQINDVNILKGRSAQHNTIVQKILNDAVRCTNGIDERIEYLFLSGLSNGVALVEDPDNVGVGIRVDFGYPKENQFTATKAWGTEGYTPISDIKRVVKFANDKGDSISYLAVSKETYDAIRHSQEGKELAAIYGGLVITSNVSLPTATPAKFNDAFKDETGCEFIVIDRTIRVEKNGIQKSVKPFNGNRVVFLTSKEVGTLYYGTLAEETNPVQQCSYTKPTQYTLVKKYHTEDPYAEITAAQAMVLPVIENTDQIYTLATDTAFEVDTTKEASDATDVKVTIGDTTYTKASVISALKTLGVKIATNATDERVIAVVNELNQAQLAAVIANSVTA